MSTRAGVTVKKAGVTVMLTMLMSMRTGDGDVDYVHVNAQG